MTYILKIFICPSSSDDGCLVANFACQKWCDFSKNKGNLTKPSSRMVADCVVVTVMTADLVLHQFFHGRGNRVLAADIVMLLKYCVSTFFGLQTLDYFLENAGCKATIPQLYQSKQELVYLFSRDGEQRLSEKTTFLPHRALFNHQPANNKINLSP